MEDARITPLSIGILGGMGPRATLHFYEQLLNYARDAYSAKRDIEYPHIFVESLPLPDFTASSFGDQTHAEKSLCEAATRLESVGSELIAMPCNTAHLFFEAIQRSVSVPVLNIISETVREARMYSTVSVLGTRMTIEENLYTSELEATGCTPIGLSSEEQIIVEELITHLEEQPPTADVHALFADLTKALATKGADALILGCTELSQLQTSSSPIPYIDSSDILARALIDRAYSTTQKSSARAQAPLQA
jgi:aspartate racemase